MCDLYFPALKQITAPLSLFVLQEWYRNIEQHPASIKVPTDWLAYVLAQQDTVAVFLSWYPGAGSWMYCLWNSHTDLIDRWILMGSPSIKGDFSPLCFTFLNRVCQLCRKRTWISYCMVHLSSFTTNHFPKRDCPPLSIDAYSRFFSCFFWVLGIHWHALKTIND